MKLDPRPEQRRATGESSSRYLVSGYSGADRSSDTAKDPSSGSHFGCNRAPAVRVEPKARTRTSGVRPGATWQRLAPSRCSLSRGDGRRSRTSRASRLPDRSRQTHRKSSVVSRPNGPVHSCAWHRNASRSAGFGTHSKDVHLGTRARAPLRLRSPEPSMPGWPMQRLSSC